MSVSFRNYNAVENMGPREREVYQELKPLMDKVAAARICVLIGDTGPMEEIIPDAPKINELAVELAKLANDRFDRDFKKLCELEFHRLDHMIPKMDFVRDRQSLIDSVAIMDEEEVGLVIAAFARATTGPVAESLSTVTNAIKDRKAAPNN